MASVNVTDSVKGGQLSLFPTEMEQMAMDIIDTYGTDTIVDIPRLRKENPRLDLAAKIAEQNKFMHWELEFADLFAERGGFDLIIGNPPWIRVEWNEQGVLSDHHPIFAVKKMTAANTTDKRIEVLSNEVTRETYFSEYESISGCQNFLNALQNYPELVGMKANLYKCFLPQSWMYSNECSVNAFVHPEGVYDDPKGGALMVSFDTISNLYDAKSIVECYEGEQSNPIPGIKDDKGNWNIIGHPSRIVHVTKKELQIFAKVFDGSNDWKKSKLPSLHVREQMEVLCQFSNCKKTLATYEHNVYSTTCWNETNAQNDGTLIADVQFPSSASSALFVGAYCGLANPIFQTARSNYRVNSDYDAVDLTGIHDDYLPRAKYQRFCSKEEYYDRLPTTPWGNKCNEYYMLTNREFVGTMSERTLVSCILPKGSTFIYTLFGIVMPEEKQMVCLNATENSLPFDFFIKVLGKTHINYGVNMLLPLLPVEGNQKIILRSLMLNCLTKHYSSLWKNCWDEKYQLDSWAKQDSRLDNTHFAKLTPQWTWDTPLRTDYERRQALVEIDVLTAMALGMTLQQLKTIYRIQFPVLQSYEADTWYDANGRITFTNNRSLVGVGFDRKEFELNMKDAPAGKKFYRTIMDDTMPGGPVERTIEYVAPFDRCDREQDYETAWKFFEEKYKEV